MNNKSKHVSAVSNIFMESEGGRNRDLQANQLYKVKKKETNSHELVETLIQTFSHHTILALVIRKTQSSKPAIAIETPLSAKILPLVGNSKYT